MNSIDNHVVLISKKRVDEELPGGRFRSTFDVLGYPGMFARWVGYRENGELVTEKQFIETSDGARFAFEEGGAAIAHWSELQGDQSVRDDRPAMGVSAPATPPADLSVETRRIVSRSLIAPRLKALDDALLPYELVATGHYRVYGNIEYYPATGFWRSRDTTAHGYTVDSLIAAARKADAKEPPAVAADAAMIVPSLNSAVHGPDDRSIEATADGTNAVAKAGDDAGALEPQTSSQGIEPPAGRLADGRTSAATSERMDVTSGGGEQPRPSAELLPRPSL